MLVPGGGVKIGARRSARADRRRLDLDADEPDAALARRPRAQAPVHLRRLTSARADRLRHRRLRVRRRQPRARAARPRLARARTRARRRASLDGLDVERVAGDLFAPGLADAMRGCDAVFHVAATYSLWRRDRAAVMRANVEGTRSVLAAARAAGVPRIVHTSSVAAIGVRADGEPADETYQSPPGELIGAYKRSKYLAEAEARRAFARGQDVVIVNPTTPVGPWDAKPTPTGEIIVRFLTGRMPAYVDTGLNVVDVARRRGRAHAGLRARRDRRALHPGQREPHAARAAGAAGGAHRAARRPALRLPRAIPLAYAALGEFVLGPLGLPPDVSLGRASGWPSSECTTTRRKPSASSGSPHRPVTRALSDAVTWFREHGYVAGGHARAEDGWRSLSSKP